MNSLPGFVVIVPMFNEESGAKSCLSAVCDELSRIPNASRFIAVDDGSIDRTRGILEEFASKNAKIVVEVHPQNRGYGAALLTGVLKGAELGFDYALFMDSDLTNSPADIEKFVAYMNAGIDVIKATRYSLGGRVAGVPLYRFLISYIGNRMAKRLYGLPINDSTNGFRAVKIGILRRMRLEERRFPIIMEELYWSRFLATSFAEVAVTLTNRGTNLRSSSFRYTPSVFWSYLKYPVRAFLGLEPQGSEEV